MQHFLSHLVQAADHEAVVAGSGLEMLERWPEYDADLVLMDLDLPGLDGLATTRRLREMAGDQWVPVIFVTGRSDDRTLHACFAAGGDDFVTKPVNVTVLTARIEAALRRAAEYHVQYEKRRELAYYRDMVEREQEVAKNIFQTICRRDQLDRTNIRYQLSPMSVFNGDLLLAAERPDGGLHLLVGDFTGHGLAASIGTLPTSEIFYAMTAKGFDMADLMAEFNRRLLALLPRGMFLAACGVAVESEGCSLRVWNGGIPDLVVRRAADGRIEQVPGRHLPLGIVDSSELGRDMDRLTIEPGDRLYLYTDGVIEAENGHGERFGLARLLASIGGGPVEHGFDRVQAALEAFRGDTDQSDDITLLEYTAAAGSRRVPAVEPGPGPQGGRGARTRWYLRLNLDPPALRAFDPRPVVTQMLMDVQALYGHRQRLYTVVAEAFAFGLEFGLLGMDPGERFEPASRRRYQDQVAARLAALEEGSLEIHVTHAPRHGGGSLQIEVMHSGIHALPDEAALAAGSGWLLKQLCSEVVVDRDEQRLSVCYEWSADRDELT